MDFSAASSALLVCEEKATGTPVYFSVGAFDAAAVGQGSGRSDEEISRI
jgi:hypothetical protein